MPRYKIIKHLTAKNIKEVGRLKPTALSIELDEPEEPTHNTHVIGFSYDKEYSDEGI